MGGRDKRIPRPRRRNSSARIAADSEERTIERPATIIATDRAPRTLRAHRAPMVWAHPVEAVGLQTARPLEPPARHQFGRALPVMDRILTAMAMGSAANDPRNRC